MWIEFFRNHFGSYGTIYSSSTFSCLLAHTKLCTFDVVFVMGLVSKMLCEMRDVYVVNCAQYEKMKS